MRTHRSVHSSASERRAATARLRARRASLAGLLALLGGACGVFDGVFDDDEGGVGDTDTGGEGEETAPPPPPSEGFRVYPKFMLEDVPAIVTLASLDGTPEPCLPDDSPAGGYLCDASGFPGGMVTIMVERDGFEMAVRHPELIPGSIDTLDVHLIIEGGPPGTWSACAPAGMFETCGDVCTNEARSCAPSSCATGQEEWPVATYEVHEAPECMTALESLVATCDDPLPAEGPGSLRCCCVD